MRIQSAQLVPIIRKQNLCAGYVLHNVEISLAEIA